jgi:hypothetical protein
MTVQTLILLLIAVVVVVYAAIAVTTWRRLRGARVVVCPETHQPVAVEADAGHAALSALRDHADIQLKTCSRWPERQNCDQGCTAQIAIAPHDTLATAILAHWFEGKRCAICQRDIAPIHSAQPKPGLMHAVTADIVAWEDVPAARLTGMLETHLPLCANCQVAETFRRRFPELVTDRPPRPTAH